MQRVKVTNQNNDCCLTECYIDGKKMEFVRSVDFHVAFDEVPSFTFGVFGLPDIDMLGRVSFDFTTKTVEEAIKVIRNELLKHDELYNGFRASILSAFREFENGIDITELADNVLKRLIGEG